MDFFVHTKESEQRLGRGNGVTGSTGSYGGSCHCSQAEGTPHRALRTAAVEVPRDLGTPCTCLALGVREAGDSGDQS